MTERLEISMNLRTFVASVSCFCRRGVINAVLNADGTTPSDNDRLTRVVRKGKTSSASCLRTDVGTELAAQLLFGTGSIQIAFVTSGQPTGSNLDHDMPEGPGTGSGWCRLCFDTNRRHFLLKNLLEAFCVDLVDNRWTTAAKQCVQDSAWSRRPKEWYNLLRIIWWSTVSNAAR